MIEVYVRFMLYTFINTGKYFFKKWWNAQESFRCYIWSTKVGENHNAKQTQTFNHRRSNFHFIKKMGKYKQ